MAGGGEGASDLGGRPKVHWSFYDDEWSYRMQTGQAFKKLHAECCYLADWGHLHLKGIAWGGVRHGLPGTPEHAPGVSALTKRFGNRVDRGKGPSEGYRHAYKEAMRFLSAPRMVFPNRE